VPDVNSDRYLALSFYDE